MTETIIFLVLMEEDLPQALLLQKALGSFWLQVGSLDGLAVLPMDIIFPLM